MTRLIAASAALLLAGFALPAPAFAQQAAATADPAHPAWLVGDWSADEGCQTYFGFLADGRMMTSDGGSTWRLEGDTLTITINNEPISRQIAKVSNDKIQIVNGPVLIRCHNTPASKP